jgi:hypothetical protein
VADWTVEAMCPHGYGTKLPFSTLGYLEKPGPGACDPHLNREAEREERRLEAAVRSPGWYRLWRETRKARKALRKGPPWLSS